MICTMDRMNDGKNQRERAIDLLKKEGVVRLREFEVAGVTAAAISRMVESGEVYRSGRGLYELSDTAYEAWHNFAEATKRIPKGVICLESALAWHRLTDELPVVVWMAIGAGDRAPKGGRPPIRVVRFIDRLLSDSVLTVNIEGVDVRIFDVAKTVADCFRHHRTVGPYTALEGLQEAIWQERATAGEIDEAARRGNVGGVVEPYLDALTAGGEP